MVDPSLVESIPCFTGLAPATKAYLAASFEEVSAAAGERKRWADSVHPDDLKGAISIAWTLPTRY